MMKPTVEQDPSTDLPPSPHILRASLTTSATQQRHGQDLVDGLLPTETYPSTTAVTRDRKREREQTNNGAQNGASRKKQKNGLNFISYVPPAPAPRRKKNLHSSARLMTWLRDNFETFRGASLAKDVAYDEYTALCQRDGKDPMLPSMFGKIVHRAFPGLQSSRTGAKGKAKHCYKGFRVKKSRGADSNSQTGGRALQEESAPDMDEENEENEPEEEEEEEFAGDEVDDELAHFSSTSSGTSTTTSSTFSSRPYPASYVIPSASSSSSSPYSSPSRSSGRSAGTTPNGQHSHSSPSTTTTTTTATGDGRFSASQGYLPSSSLPSLVSPTDNAHSSPQFPAGRHRDLDMLLLPPVLPPCDRQPSSFLGMLHSPPPPPHHHHVATASAIHEHLQQLQHSTRQPQPVLSSTPYPPPYSSCRYPPHPHYPTSPSNTVASIQPDHAPTRPRSSPPTPTIGPCGEPEPSSFFFPPYISPLSVPLPFASPSFFSQPQPAGPFTAEPACMEMCSTERNRGKGLPGLDSYSSPDPSSSSSSPSGEGSFERDVDTDLRLLELSAGTDYSDRPLHHEPPPHHQLYHQQRSPYLLGSSHGVPDRDNNSLLPQSAPPQSGQGKATGKDPSTPEQWRDRHG